jgi:hypothetical protein
MSNAHDYLMITLRYLDMSITEIMHGVGSLVYGLGAQRQDLVAPRAILSLTPVAHVTMTFLLPLLILRAIEVKYIARRAPEFYIGGL